MGGSGSFEELFETYKNMVYNRCMHYLVNEEDAQDATQEIFVKIYHNLDKYDAQQSKLSTWISRITINFCIDLLRAKKRKSKFMVIFPYLNLHPGNEAVTDLQIEHPGFSLEDKESLNTLMKIIYRLPETQKSAVILTRIEDLPQKEVAEIMNCSVKAVEALLQRAKKFIVKELELAKENNQ